MKELVEYYQPLLGQYVKLVPLLPSHRAALVAAGADGELWRLWFTSVPNEQTVDSYLALAEKQLSEGTGLPFAVIDLASDKVIGTTRYCNAEIASRRLEIGYTFYAKSYQRSAVNTECKLLMLRHAFENMQAIAVEFRTHWHNHASRAAIARLGAKQDGVLRNHKIHPDGELRDTVVFSIIESEWPVVKKSLIHKAYRQ